MLPLIFSCQQPADTARQTTESATPKTLGKIERLSPELDKVLPADAQIEVLGEGYTWAEGPVWVGNGGYLLFTDVPENKIYQWKEGAGVQVYLTHSGFTGEKTDSPEPGANGLALDANGALIACQHGDRRVVRMTAPLDAPKPVFESLADRWNNKRFNSPNDLCIDSKGNVYFTDPPYGLRKQTEDTLKEIPFQGVYRRNVDGKVDLLVDSLSRPNGIALSPDEKTLYVAVSDPAKALWMAYSIQPNGQLANGRVFYNATSMVGETYKGLPDGLKVSKAGLLFATGPGGVWIFKPDGTALGRVSPGVPTANCALDRDEKTLFLTSDMYLCRVRLK